ncbi:autoinducer synthase [Sphingomonas sp. PL-96]|uniref:acyl-homoserine-lactone synthase n=1 Tax=Sphingomonas sp. PL-96 TaxID=2887201 RepID=UPI001E43C97C|nr:acyl-homoserine-lactone synthase [Sphingomonas sp. PL-96]MCC2977134.1 autoinducer synthase [Sphingomonas sp. PL-96]
MIQLIQAKADPTRHAVLRNMFAARKQVFVDLLGWDVPVLAGTYEVDQFDNEAARYLVITDDDGKHLASTRLLPTTRPHLLGDLFPMLCEAGVPTDRHVFEITRFCLDRSLTAHRRRELRNALVVALVDHAHATGIRAYSAITGMSWFQQILAFGWRCRPLGLPQIIQGEMLVAIEITIDADTRPRLAAAGIVAVAPAEALAA